MSKENGSGEKISKVAHNTAVGWEYLVFSPFLLIISPFTGLIHWVQRRFFGVGKPMSGNEAIELETATVVIANDGIYKIRVEGELWNFCCDDEDLKEGDQVLITSIYGMEASGRKL